jgi:hypothetical protein
MLMLIRFKTIQSSLSHCLDESSVNLPSVSFDRIADIVIVDFMRLLNIVVASESVRWASFKARFRHF